MRFGAVYPQAEIGNDPAFIKQFAQSVEAAGFSYLTAFDHILGAGVRAVPLLGRGDRQTGLQAAHCDLAAA